MKPVHHLFLAGALLLAGTQVQGQKLERGELGAPDSLRAATSIVVSYDVDYDITSPSAATLTYRKVVTLLNGDDPYGNQLFEFYDDDSKITSFKAAAFNAFGQEIFKAKGNDISDSRYTSQSSFYEDSRVKHVEVPCSSYPCTLVFEVEKRVADFGFVAGFSHWQPVTRGQSLVEASFTVHLPSSNKLLYRSHLLAEPAITTEGGGQVYRWSVSNLPAQAREPIAPAEPATLPYLRLGLNDFEIDGYHGSYRSWADYGKFMNQIMAGRDELPAPLAAKVRETVAGANTEWEKIDRLYRFMQERMRYVSIQLGIGGWQPFSATYVEENRFGDCKALSNYMGAMLKEVGIASYPVLINWNDQPDYPVTEEFTSPAFNHMVLYIPSQDMYLECTSNDAPTGYLGEGKQDRNVLWITPEGGKLVRTPALEPAANGLTRTVNVNLASTGETAVDIHATFYGGAQEEFRSFAARNADAREQLKRLHELDYLPDVSGSGYVLQTHPDRPEVDLRYRTSVTNYVRKLGKRMFVPINGYFAFNYIPDNDTDRQLPIVTHTARFIVDTINLDLPPELEFESGGGESLTAFSHAAGEYQCRVTPTETGLRWIRTLRLLPVELPKEAYADYRQFFLDVAKADRMQVVVREKRSK